MASLVLASSSDRIVFDDSLGFAKIDFRKHPQLDRIGRSDQGVLPIEPCKILPHWRFKIPAEAKKSSAKIFRMLLAYLKGGDFPGADMARKFLQMAGPDRGVTRTTRGAASTIRRRARPAPDDGSSEGIIGSHFRRALRCRARASRRCPIEGPAPRQVRELITCRPEGQNRVTRCTTLGRGARRSASRRSRSTVPASRRERTASRSTASKRATGPSGRTRRDCRSTRTPSSSSFPISTSGSSPRLRCAGTASCFTPTSSASRPFTPRSAAAAPCSMTPSAIRPSRWRKTPPVRSENLSNGSAARTASGVWPTPR